MWRAECLEKVYFFKRDAFASALEPSVAHSPGECKKLSDARCSLGGTWKQGFNNGCDSTGKVDGEGSELEDECSETLVVPQVALQNLGNLVIQTRIR